MASEGPDVRIRFMNELARTRRRSTEAVREAERLSLALALVLGRGVRAGRERLGMTQATLAARVEVDQSRISQVERGLGQGVPLDLWVRLGVALERPLAISFTKPLGEAHQPADAGHLAMQERLLELARATGRTASFELPTRPADPRYSIDVCTGDTRHRVLLIQEAWNTFGDLGAAVRSTNRKTGSTRPCGNTRRWAALPRRDRLDRQAKCRESRARRSLPADLWVGISGLVAILGEGADDGYCAAPGSGPGLA